ncbi:MAG: type II toxin-antitoxin system VapC family toxin [Chloroflexi bacterium]|nr:type II toxin-antitoxin system VapC family toxin [Chloroflexota bacterium]
MNGRPGVVLDASALLAAVLGEPGEVAVREALPVAAISSVNWSEVLQKTIASGSPVEGLRDEFERIGLVIQPFTAEDAALAASLWTRTRTAGLSLADRACLALGARLGLPVLTTDHPWASLDVGVNVRLLR